MNTNENQVSAANGGPAETAQLPDDMLIILPVRNMVLFPGVVLPVAIKRDRTVAGAQGAGKPQEVLQGMRGSGSPAAR